MKKSVLKNTVAEYSSDFLFLKGMTSFKVIGNEAGHYFTPIVKISGWYTNYN